jgi:hypothetical protein
LKLAVINKRRIQNTAFKSALAKNAGSKVTAGEITRIEDTPLNP